MRVATKTISGLYDGATTRELDQLSIQTAAALIVEEPQYAQARGAPARHLHRQGSPQPGDPRLLAVDRDRAPRSAWSTSASPSFVADERAQAQRRDRRRARPRVRVLRPAHASTTATCCKHPQTRLVIETPQQFFLRIACALSETRRRGARALPAVLVARVPAELADAVQRRHAPRAALELLPARLARTTTSRASTSATPTSRCSRSSRAASASRTTACARAAR